MHPEIQDQLIGCLMNIEKALQDQNDILAKELGEIRRTVDAIGAEISHMTDDAGSLSVEVRGTSVEKSK